MSSKVGLVCTLVMLLTVSAVSPAYALLMETDAQPTDRPVDGVVGLWGTTADVVVISPNMAITTCHQSGTNYADPGHPEVVQSMANVTIGSTVYYPKLVAWGGGNGGVADIRIVQLWADPAHTIQANLTNYVGLYTGTNEIGKNIVLAGAGMTRGATLYRGQQDYGYAWTGNRDNTNGIRWGTNTIELTNTLDNTDVIKARFEGPGYSNSTTYEAIGVTGDDGGGMFIKGTDGQWYVAGLIKSGAHVDQAVYLNSGTNVGDLFSGVRISSYASWINQNIGVAAPEPLTISLMTLGGLAVLRRKR